MRRRQKPMFVESRRQEITKLIQEKGFVTVNDLSSLFQVTTPTIRGDLIKLEQLGVLQRTHGGAIKIENSHSSKELTSKEKSVRAVSQKQMIAKAAVEYVKPGSIIALDTGTTTLELAKLVVDIPNITVITNDLNIALCLEENSSLNVYLLGGMLRCGFHCTIGRQVLDELKASYIDTFFMATNGVSMQRGFSTPNIDMADIKREFIGASNRIVALVDSTKVGSEAFATFARLDEVDVFISDDRISAEFVDELNACGISTVVVK